MRITASYRNHVLQSLDLLVPVFQRITAYCFKCRAKREMKLVETLVLKNGRPATRGFCPVCGIQIFRIGAAPPALGYEEMEILRKNASRHRNMKRHELENRRERRKPRSVPATSTSGLPASALTSRVLGE